MKKTKTRKQKKSIWHGYLKISHAEYQVAKSNNFYYESEGVLYDLLSPETEVIVWRGNYLDPVFHHFNREGKITREKVERINSKKQKLFAK